MLRDIGRVLQKRVSPKDVPGGYLSYQFGWAPFLSDAAALIGLTEEIDARRRFFENLEDGRSINRTLLREVDVEDSSGYSELGLAWTERTTLSRRIWYSSRWRLSPEWTLPELAAESTSLGTLFGIGGPRTRGISASTIWNAIPWSWLIDYLTNFGTLLEANRGYAPLKLTSMCLMCQDDDRTVPVPTITPPGVVWDLGYLRRTVKRRFVVGVSSPMIRLTPFLTERQTTILGALALVTAIRRATS